MLEFQLDSSGFETVLKLGVDLDNSLNSRKSGVPRQGQYKWPVHGNNKMQLGFCKLYYCFKILYRKCNPIWLKTSVNYSHCPLFGMSLPRNKLFSQVFIFTSYWKTVENSANIFKHFSFFFLNWRIVDL